MSDQQYLQRQAAIRNSLEQAKQGEAQAEQARTLEQHETAVEYMAGQDGLVHELEDIFAAAGEDASLRASRTDRFTQRAKSTNGAATTVKHRKGNDVESVTGFTSQTSNLLRVGDRFFGDDSERPECYIRISIEKGVLATGLSARQLRGPKPRVDDEANQKANVGKRAIARVFKGKALSTIPVQDFGEDYKSKVTVEVLEGADILVARGTDKAHFDQNARLADGSKALRRVALYDADLLTRVQRYQIAHSLEIQDDLIAIEAQLLAARAEGKSSKSIAQIEARAAQLRKALKSAQDTSSRVRISEGSKRELIKINELLEIIDGKASGKPNPLSRAGDL